MPSAQCGGCRKFLSPPEAAKCTLCSAFYHRACVALPLTGPLASAWYCPECTKDEARNNKADTPVRGRHSAVQSKNVCELMDTSTLDTTSLNITTGSCPTLVDELRIFKEELRAEIMLVRRDLQQLRMEISQIKDLQEKSEARVGGLEHRMEIIEHKLKDTSQMDDKIQLEHAITELRQQLNERDQEMLLNDLIVAGIPEGKEESIIHHVKTLSAKLGVDLDERDVVYAERVGPARRNRVESTNTNTGSSGDADERRPRVISVRFARRSVRDMLLKAARVRRGLNTEGLQAGGRTQRVYVNERLTRVNSSLFYRARQVAIQQKWRYVWTRDGKIYARKGDGLNLERIRCEADISKIFGHP